MIIEENGEVRINREGTGRLGEYEQVVVKGEKQGRVGQM